MKVKVIKDCYYVSDGSVCEDEYLTKEELFRSIAHLLVEGDIWETSIDDPELWICTSGEWKNEFNDGWWNYDQVKHCFEEIK